MQKQLMKWPLKSRLHKSQHCFVILSGLKALKVEIGLHINLQRSFIHDIQLEGSKVTQIINQGNFQGIALGLRGIEG